MCRDAVRSPAAGEPHLDDPAFPALCQSTRAAVRAAGSVHHRWGTTGAVAVGPFLGRRRRTLEPFSSPAQSPSVIDNGRREPQPAPRSQTGISVGHEDLSVIDVRCGNHTDTGGPHLHSASHAVHNLSGSYT